MAPQNMILIRKYVITQMFMDFLKSFTWQNIFLSVVFIFIQGGPRNPKFNLSEDRTGQMRGIPRKTNQHKAEEYVTYVTKDRFKEYLKIAKELV